MNMTIRTMRRKYYMCSEWNSAGSNCTILYADGELPPCQARTGSMSMATRF